MVYVDEIQAVDYYRAGCCDWRYRYACHMMADSDEELEAMRKKLGLRPSHRHADHYDLTRGKRSQAIALGAKPITAREMVEIRRKRRTQRR